MELLDTCCLWIGRVVIVAIPVVVLAVCGLVIGRAIRDTVTMCRNESDFRRLGFRDLYDVALQFLEDLKDQILAFRRGYRVWTLRNGKNQ